MKNCKLPSDTRDARDRRGASVTFVTSVTRGRAGGKIKGISFEGRLQQGF